MSRRSLVALACAVPLALGLAACGKVNDPTSTENDGVYVQGGPITYQLQVSRLLNQYSTEDSQYLTGLTPANAALGTTNQWYMVSLWAKNQSSRPANTTGNFDIVDTQGNYYYPVPVNTSANLFAWRTQSLNPGQTEPLPDTAASWGPTQGGILLFKVPNTIFNNRPLTLQIKGPTGKVWGTISLDL